jgi:hypothetical protein
LWLLVTSTACSGGNDSSSDTTALAAPATTSAVGLPPTVPETTTPASGREDPPPATNEAPDVDAAGDEVTPPSAAPLTDGVEPTVELVTRPQTGEIRPLLEWSPVGGAAYYLATLCAPDGTPYWAWTGPATSVHVGGEPKLSDDVPGPSVVAGMTWGVVALDDALVPIASSDRRVIAP